LNLTSNTLHYLNIIRQLICWGAFAVTVPLSASGQSADVIHQLRRFDITPADFLVNLQPVTKNYAFHFTITEDEDGAVTTMECSYDPAAAPTWKLNKYCGKKPGISKNKILKNRVAAMAKDTVRIDGNSISIKKLSYYLIVTFSADSTTLPPLYAYIKDCKGTAYINAATKRLEKITYENFRGTQLGTISVSSLHQDVFVDIIDGSYRTVKEWREISGKENSQSKTYTETVDFSVYEKRQTPEK
jgi:hypothetical protein